MRETLKFMDVRLSRAGADDGVDVKSREGIAQVKWYASPVGISEVQRLRGTTSGTEWALFYASVRGYTKAANEAATRGNVALFTLLAETGLAIPVNHVAKSLERMRRGIPQQVKADGEPTLGSFMATSRRRWELNSAIRVHEARVDKIKDAVVHMQSVLQDLTLHDPEAAKDLRELRHVWTVEDNPADYEQALESFRHAVDWRNRLPGGIDTNTIEIIAFQEAVLPALPELVRSVASAVPVDRSSLNEWCDYWTERRFRAQYEPRRRMPQSAVLREHYEKLIARGPDRSDLARHAESMAVRVV
jgi:hypothetical protein